MLYHMYTNNEATQFQAMELEKKGGLIFFIIVGVIGAIIGLITNSYDDLHYYEVSTTAVHSEKT